MEQVEKMSTSQLITEEDGDPEVSPIFSRSVSESEVSQNSTCYFTKNGVPMKMWRPRDVSTEEEWAVQYQMIVLIVTGHLSRRTSRKTLGNGWYEVWAVQYQMIVPKTYRPDVLSTAGETPLPGQLGLNKTCKRFLDHFYGLSLRKVVAQYC